ncbi:MAG: SIS domain-containing protein [Conexivisphaerales archaeon]
MDADDMLAFYESWPQLFLPVKPEFKTKSANKIIATGYGASLIPLMMVGELSREGSIKILHPGEMPKGPKSDTTFLAVSHSGDTIETINALVIANRLGYNCISIGGGGILERKSRELGVEFIKVNTAPTSRLGLPYLLSGISPVVDKLFGTNLTETFQKMFEDLSKTVSSLGAEAKALAEFENGSSYVGLYFSNSVESVAYRLRYVISENAKVHSIFENIMEVVHNGITAWEMTYGLPVFMIRSNLDDDITKRRFDLISQALGALGNRVRSVFVKRNELLSAIFMLDLSTVYLSILRKVNPFSTQTQATIREKIKAYNDQ